jgi:hypothetical protein
MVWIYNSPLTEKERKAYDVLNKRFGDPQLAKDTVKIVSLVGTLNTKKFETQKEIQDYFFYDKDQQEPIFNKTTSERLIKQLKKKEGGGLSNYPFIDYSARQGLEKARNVLPEFIVFPIENFYKLLTTPLLTLKETFPLADIAISAANGMAETGITFVGDLAKTVGGPMGTLISIPVVAFAAAIATTSSMLQRDLGQSVVYMVTALPFVGAIMAKGLDKVEKQVTKVKKYPQIAYYVPFISDYINEERKEKGLPPLEPFDPAKAIQNKIESNSYVQKAKSIAPVSSFPALGGKRFSTRKHSINKKWHRTRRIKSAKI